MTSSGSIEMDVAVGEPPVVTAIEGRSPLSIAMRRLRRDKVSLVAGALIVLLVIIAIFAPLIVQWLGHPPDEPHYDKLSPAVGAPIGPLGGISSEHILGVEPGNGRDVFSRIVYGARVSLLVAVLASAVSVIIGTTIGMLAAYVGGWVDYVLSRLMDVLLAFPLILFGIALVTVVPDGSLGLSGNGLRIGILVFLIGFFNWPYIGRIIRAQTLSLKEMEFVEAARGEGRGSTHIMFREILPNLLPSILVYSTLIIPTNILLEAGLSFLGVGIRPPAPSWGDMLSTAVDSFTYDPMFLIIPGVAIFITVIAFNLFGDGLRDAFDPRSSR